MRLATWTSYAVLAAAAFVLAPAANADNATLRDCTQAARQVSQALDKVQSNDKRNAARSEQRAGHHYCMQAKYDKGVAHYNRAIQILSDS